MIVCGLGGTVAQRTIIETGEFFGWIGVRMFEYISVFNLVFSICFSLNYEYVPHLILLKNAMTRI